MMAPAPGSGDGRRGGSPTGAGVGGATPGFRDGAWQDRVRVLLLRTRYPHWSGHAALNRFAKAVDPRGFDVRERLVEDGDGDFPLRLAPFRQLARLATCSPRMPYYRLSDVMAEAVALREAMRDRIEIVHYLDGEHGARHLPPLLRRLGRGRTRTIATYHQPPEFLDAIVPTKVVRALDMITVMAPHQADWFERHVGPERVRVILHPANTDFFRPPRERAPNAHVRCITVGHWLRDWAAMGAVVRKLADHPDVHFDLVTGGQTGCEALDQVTHHRGVSDARLLALYQEADLLLLPLVSGTANNALLEGIACGLPVVTTDMPATRAYLPDDAGLFIRGNEPSAIVDAILYLRDAPARRLEMGREARRRAESLSWARIAPEYERLYRDIANA